MAVCSRDDSLRRGTLLLFISPIDMRPTIC